MLHITFLFFIIFLSVSSGYNPAWAAPQPALMLANRYHDGIAISDYWVSEKLDGVRAYWEGERFISRQGNEYHAPEWFTKGFPSVPLDGELWMGRGTFEALSGAVRKEIPDDKQWQRIRFMVFDLPAAGKTFDHRLMQLRTLLTKLSSPYIQLVAQEKLPSREALMARLDQVISEGGEGLMLHLGRAPYRATRSDDLLKLKRYQDDEAVVVSHLPGKGKYAGMMGALLVEMPNGLRFKIGTGFSDEQRHNPPAIGRVITYKYVGKTSKGIPRFASFLRENGDL